MTISASTHTGRGHASPAQQQPFGDHLRFWRQQRRRSQLDLAHEADVSARHLSFVETGRSLPSREMVLRLSERLAIPLRQRNVLLVAAGYAPLYRERPLDDPALAAAREAVDRVLKAHEPYPALAIDRHWNLVSCNRSVPILMAGCADFLIAPPVNVLRLSLHPQGLASRIANFSQWRDHLLERLRQQIAASADPVLALLFEELRGFPAPDGSVQDARAPGEVPGVVVPFCLRFGPLLLNFISTTTIFGSPTDVTLQEVAMETFFPADRETGEALRQLAASSEPAPHA